MRKALLLGTSRLHRPFARSVDRQVQVNKVEGLEPVFARSGYFHTAAESLQVIRHAKYPELLPRDLRSRAYRIEPRATTPLNEFDARFENAIRTNAAARPPFSPEDVDALIVEVSSLTVNTHVPTGHVLHTNPNFDRNVPYSDLYPEGYYAKFDPDVLVARSETTLQELTSQLHAIRAELPRATVLILGHLRSKNHPNAGRDRIHSLLQEASTNAGCEYVDTAPFLDEYGFAENDGVRDPHHLTLAGEIAFGRYLQARVLEKS
ncbi:SGNH/GDSL hydrolase family protein [uncultured Microbacterium sp.]|uniref:SGNH/GDSL hydrolase family protein n=1 Tax=uncultured Microbacterium sp. TaxID=191216 RepID=UPI0026165F8E|nr:SGNH/GDSL hydrolase family protein [uncultured Microbacterium sp.]